MTRTWITGALALGLLAGCGGDGGSPGDTPVGSGAEAAGAQARGGDVAGGPGASGQPSLGDLREALEGLPLDEETR